jgi:hypothetical protein
MPLKIISMLFWDSPSCFFARCYNKWPRCCSHKATSFLSRKERRVENNRIEGLECIRLTQNRDQKRLLLCNVMSFRVQKKGGWEMFLTKRATAGHSGRAVWGMTSLRPLEHWDRGFESHLIHRCLCESTGLASGWSPV